jgi:hypothetical protein
MSRKQKKHTMSSLVNTTWKITATNRDFLTCTVKFLTSGVATISWSNGVATNATWKEGKRFFSFTLNTTYPFDGSEFNFMGTHQDGKGNGQVNIEHDGGVQWSPFEMVKMS